MNLLTFNQILNNILEKNIYTVYHDLDIIDSSESEVENELETEFSISGIDNQILQLLKSHNFMENLKLENYFIQEDKNEYIILHSDYQNIEKLFQELSQYIYSNSVPTLFIKYYMNDTGFEYTYLTIFEKPKLYLVFDYSDREVNIYYSSNLKKLIEETEYCCK
jgi:hypothetical protein